MILGGTPELALVTNRRLLASREVIMVRFLRCLLEGIHAVQTRPELARDVLVQQGVASSPAAADTLVQAYLARTGSARVPYLDKTAVEALVSQSGEAMPDADRLLDQSILRRLEASGFVTGLYRT